MHSSQGNHHLSKEHHHPSNGTHSRVSCVRLFVTLWTAAHQAPLPMGLSRQEYWSGLPCPHQAPLPMGLSGQEHWSGLPCPPRGSPHPGKEPRSALVEGSSPLMPPGKPIHPVADAKPYISSQFHPSFHPLHPPTYELSCKTRPLFFKFSPFSLLPPP